MERALKERIIGAVVLVVFVVLVVPIFLDGPPEEAPVISERVLLPGQEAQDTKVVVLDRERSVPIPAVSKSTDTPAPTNEAPAAQAATVREPTPKPIVAESATPAVAAAVTEPAGAAPSPTVAEATSQQDASSPASSATGMWAVQLGSFSNKENAEGLAASLRDQGYAAFLSRTESGGKALHRVRIGPQKDRASADQMAARLAKVGHRGQVLPHP